MATITKKAWPEFFEAILSGKKKYDFRLADFEVSEGDILRLEEWDPGTKSYTGRTLEKKVTYVSEVKTDKLFWPKEDVEQKGLVIMSLE